MITKTFDFLAMLFGPGKKVRDNDDHLWHVVDLPARSERAKPPEPPCVVIVPPRWEGGRRAR